MKDEHRRGSCPGLSAPIATGDGLLVRFVAAHAIPLGSFAALCAAARRHGNGTIEISARGSLQLRGLTCDSAPSLASAIAALDIAGADGTPVITDPLDEDPEILMDTRDLAANLRRAIAEARLVLAPKVSVLVDGGGRLHLESLTADLRLRAIGSLQSPRLFVMLGGDGASAVPLGSIAPGSAVEVVIRTLGVIAAHGRAARAVDILRSAGTVAFRAAAGTHLEDASAPSPRPPAEAVGRHRLRDGTLAIGVAPAFGHAHADAFMQLSAIAAAFAVRSMRPAPGRVLLMVGAAEEAAAPLAATAERLGFIVRTDDPRRRITACPGRPGCASGMIASRALASAIGPHLHRSIHISGCAKGCAHPAPADLTVVGTERGCGIVRHGSTQATPRYYIDAAELPAEVMRIGVETGETIHG